MFNGSLHFIPLREGPLAKSMSLGALVRVSFQGRHSSLHRVHAVTCITVIRNWIELEIARCRETGTPCAEECGGWGTLILG